MTILWIEISMLNKKTFEFIYCFKKWKKKKKKKKKKNIYIYIYNLIYIKKKSIIKSEKK